LNVIFFLPPFFVANALAGAVASGAIDAFPSYAAHEGPGPQLLTVRTCAITPSCFCSPQRAAAAAAGWAEADVAHGTRRSPPSSVDVLRDAGIDRTRATIAAPKLISRAL
jgi:hypothetical protein